MVTCSLLVSVIFRLKRRLGRRELGEIHECCEPDVWCRDHVFWHTGSRRHGSRLNLCEGSLSEWLDRRRLCENIEKDYPGVSNDQKTDKKRSRNCVDRSDIATDVYRRYDHAVVGFNKNL